MAAIDSINGLLASNNCIDVISNNIANASTIGYKSSKPIFFDIFSNSFESNKPLSSGVGISDFIQNFENGMLVETGKDLDLGIINTGFFRVLDHQGNVHYTRNGQFTLDKNKNIVNMQGMYLTGKNKFNTEQKTNSTYNMQPINLNNSYILPAKPTSNIAINVNLNSNTNYADNIKNVDGSSEDLSKKPNYSTDIIIYNKNGKPETVTISFYKIKDNNWKIVVESDEIKESKEKNINNTFDIIFDSNGQIISNPHCNIELKNSKYKNIDLDLTGTIEQTEIDNSVEASSQDGYKTGILKSFEILPNGEILGTYSNEQIKSMSQILLSKFANPTKLKPESGSTWSSTESSGKEEIGTAGENGFGVLTEKSLEASNVDLNKELINMIIAQRNYQSNAQSFKTEDKIISTLINLR